MIDLIRRLGFSSLFITALFYSTLAFSIDSYSKYVDKDLSGFTDAQLASLFQGVQEELSRIDNKREYIKGERLFFDVLSNAYPNVAEHWNDVVIFRGVRVVQSDDIIDLDRFIVDNRYGYPGHVYEYSSSPSYPGLSSRLRMKRGFAPVGPDNDPLLLCRFNNNENASYFEISRDNAWRVLNQTYSGMSIERACIYESMFQSYWKFRLSDMINPRGDVVIDKRSFHDKD